MHNWWLSVRPKQSSCRKLRNALLNYRRIWKFWLHRYIAYRRTTKKPWNRKMRQSRGERDIDEKKKRKKIIVCVRCVCVFVFV